MKKNILKPIDIVFAILGTICILIFVIHYSTFFISAANTSGPQLPIYVENIDVSPYQNFINNTYGGFWNLSQDNVIGWGTQENGYYVQAFAVPQVASEVQNYLSFSPNNLSAFYPSFNYNDNTLTLTFTNLANNNNKPWRIIYFYSNGVGPSYPYSATFNNSSSVNLGVYGYTGKSLNYVSSTIYLTNNNAWVVNMPVFVNELIPVISSGHATEPEFNNNDDLINYDPRQPNTPSFPIFPTINIDTSSIETLLESIFDLVSNFADYVGECFSVFFSWIVEVIQNGIQSIINTIRDFNQNLYENFVSLFEPIAERIEYLTEPISSTIIFDNISNTSLVSNIGIIESSLNSFSNSFNNLSEPSSYTIPIHLENMPTTLFGNLTTQYIDLSIINPVKDILRVFVWALTTYGLFITIVDSISNYINGGQDE